MVGALMWIALGLALLGLGGELLVRGSVALAKLLRISPAMIGLTIVAAGTSVPELAVSLVAAMQGSSAIAIGNVVGSNIFNILVILGLGAILSPLAITGNTIKWEYPFLALVTVAFILVCMDGTVSRIEAGAFVAAQAGFLGVLTWIARRQRGMADLREFEQEAEELDIPAEAPPMRLRLSLTLILGGMAMLAVGARATVHGAVELAEMIGMSERVIGLTVVAAGTGLPEVAASLVAGLRGRPDVAIGNVIGSNLFNVLAIVGITGLVRPLEVPPETISADNWWLAAVTAMIFPMMVTDRQIRRLEGSALLGLYAVYVWILVTR